ncbi:Y-family DNA polymerase [Azospirillum griseum]|uniref:DNA-directed DNA polymerase n=1 Tax=Azospirillum griseum TaxID=2496639 RepID=A0A3S0HX67_9PROT|nr:DNA polymerase Y family protein [Azospirillum griseum]RTR15663.1 DNA polymerase Y family protein [Azospirillum griseum]
MRRVVSVCLPRWPTDRLRATGRRAQDRLTRNGASADASVPADHPLVIADVGSARLLTATDATAHRLGLRPGMPLAKARALVPTLLVVDADPDADTDGLQRLAQWALRYSPIASIDPPDGLWIDITGASHLVGGERALLDDVIQRLAAMGVTARAAVAATPGAAGALARFGHRPVVIADDGLDLLHGLPVAALRVPGETVVALRRLGFDTVGDLEQTARAPLVHRFGTALLRRLDQMFGRIDEPLTPVAVADVITITHSLVEPISTAEALRVVLSALVTELCHRLERRGLGARSLDLRLHRVDGSRQDVQLGTAQPVRSAAHLTRLLTDRIDRIDPGWGIERADLTATLTEALAPKPVGHLSLAGTALDTAVDTADLAALIDILGNRIGHDRLYRLVPVESDVPERCLTRVPPLSPPTGRNWLPDWPRPGRLLTPPEPIETMALLPDHPPLAFTWRGVRRLIKRADGPERVHGEWWRRDREMAAARDYYAVEDQDGGRYWLYRSWEDRPETGPMRWFIHGLFG